MQLPLLLFATLLVTAALLNGAETKNVKFDDFLQSSKWPNGMVLYKWNTEFPPKDQQPFLDAMNYIEAKTCIKYYPFDEAPAGADTSSYLLIGSEGRGCWAHIGRADGPVKLNLADEKCFDNPGIAIHEFMHTLGMRHTVQRFDRDRHVDIYWGNISQDMTHNFIVSQAESSVTYAPYDLSSLMHYSSKDFVTDWNLDTMEPRSSTYPESESAKKLMNRVPTEPSHYDLMAINKHYGCADHCPEKETPCKFDSYEDKDCICQCVSGTVSEGLLFFGDAEKVFCGNSWSTNRMTESCGEEVNVNPYNLNDWNDPLYQSIWRREWKLNCSYLGYSKPGLRIRAEFKHLLVKGPGDRLEVRWRHPGQLGETFVHDHYNPPQPPTRYASSAGRGLDTPYLMILHYPVGGNHLLWNAKVKAVADPAVVNMRVDTDCEEDWKDLYYIWDTSRPYEDKYNVLSTKYASGGNRSLEMVSVQPFVETWIQTKAIWEGKTRLCIEFDYYAIGAGGKKAKLEVKNLYRPTAVTHFDIQNNTIETIEDDSETWISKNVTVVNMTNWSIVRFNLADTECDGCAIYLDNIKIYECITPPPPPPTLPPGGTMHYYHESFEYEADMNDWRKSGVLAHEWHRHTGETPTRWTGPNGAYKGQYYLYLECSLHGGKTATIRPEKFFYDGNEALCVKFAYCFYGGHIGELGLYQLDHATMSEWTMVWHKSTVSDSERGWRIANFSIPATGGKPYALAFQGKCGDTQRWQNFENDLAIDEVTFQSCSSLPGPTPPPPVQSTIHLTFEDPRTWDSAITIQGTLSTGVYWQRHKGETPSRRTGPSYFLEGSYYIYMETSGRAKPGEVAEFIINRVFETNEGLDLKFLLQMHGANDMRSELISLDASDHSIQVIEWEFRQVWYHWVIIEVSIEAKPYKWQLMFRGNRGWDYRSDISVDDFLINIRESTPPTTSTLAPTEPPERGNSPMGDRSYGNMAFSDKNLVQESFENGVLEFSPKGSTSDAYLKLHTGPTKTKKTGPTAASDGDHYMYFEASDVSAGAISEFIANKKFDGDEEVCVLFDYHMYGSQTGTLEVVTMGDADVTHWSVSGQDVDAWQEANVVIAPQDAAYQLEFKYTHIGGKEADVALDNILIAKGPCRRITVGEDCPRCDTDYKSENMTCYPEHLDGNPYCSAYGFARDSLWNAVKCGMRKGFKDGYAMYVKDCLLPICSMGYDNITDTDVLIQTLHLKTICEDRNGFFCDICCPDHCDSGGVSLVPGLATRIAAAFFLALYLRTFAF